MITHVYTPAPPLSQLIELMWFYDEYHLPHRQELALSTGTLTLVINLALHEATLCGAHAKPFLLDTTRLVSHLGVHFRPGGAAPFLRLPVNDMMRQLDRILRSASLQYGKIGLPNRALCVHPVKVNSLQERNDP